MFQARKPLHCLPQGWLKANCFYFTHKNSKPKLWPGLSRVAAGGGRGRSPVAREVTACVQEETGALGVRDRAAPLSLPWGTLPRGQDLLGRI